MVPLAARMRLATFVLLGLSFAILPACPVHAVDDVDGPIDFVKQVQPIFASHCYPCHGPRLQESNYRLDSRPVALGTADLGDRPIVPGQGDTSPLVEFILGGPQTGMAMPPEGEGEPLTAKQVAIIRKWIDQGAVWPDEAAGPNPEELLSELWSLQPVQRIDPPEIERVTENDSGQSGDWDRKSWSRNPIDRFIVRKLRERGGLTPSPPADRRTLIRRLYLDMLGLPPSPEQVDAFVSSADERAYESLVEEVLASPRYGERWAQHWLDVVRYADTDGFEVNTARPNAWPYRDYVIDAFNHDKPYDQFVYEQLAGDRVGEDVATGFLVAAPDLLPGQIGKDEASMLAARQEEMDEFVQGVTATLMGLTVNCARCHNHKFDPILQSDYFSMQAILAGVSHGEREVAIEMSDSLRERLSGIEADIADVRKNLETFAFRAPVEPGVNEERFEPIEGKYIRFTVFETNNREPCLDELEVFAKSDDAFENNLALNSLGAIPTSSGNFADTTRHKLEHINDGQYGNARSWISDSVGSGWVQIELAQPAIIAAVRWGRDRQRQFTDRLATQYQVQVALAPGEWTTVASSGSRLHVHDQSEKENAAVEVLSREEVARTEQLLHRLNELQAQHRALKPQASRQVYTAQFHQPEPTHRLLRGNHQQPREQVRPDIPGIFGSLNLPVDAEESERRHRLAEWLIRHDNPLVARVMVNRIWHYHFGVGIVDTPSDFGHMGGVPTHPELLDWLATEFMDHGWSVKHIQRLILNSRTYRQSSVANRPGPLAVDADARLLWRFPSRRLEAEAIRDSILKVAGTLNLQMGGPGFHLYKPRVGLDLYVPKDSYGPEEWRRMIYAHKVRMEKDGVFAEFDMPDCGQPVPRRSRSTTAIQALNLFNSDFVATHAAHFANRVIELAGADLRRQVDVAFRLALNRSPTDTEAKACHDLVENHSLRDLCRVLLNTNEFVMLP